LRGMINLMMLLLLCYHIRMIAQSLKEHNFVLTKEINAFWESGALFDMRNYTTGLVTLFLGIFAAVSFMIETKIGKTLPDKIVSYFF